MRRKNLMMKVVGTGILPPANPGDCGFDLFADTNVSLWGLSSVLVEIDAAIQIPQGYFGKIFSRSGLSVKHGIEVGAGVIDSSYTGKLKVHVYNHSSEFVIIPKGKAIAQLVIIPFEVPTLQVVETLDVTVRGSAGFGSTDSSRGRFLTTMPIAEFSHAKLDAIFSEPGVDIASDVG